MKDALKEREYTQETVRRAPSRLAPSGKHPLVRQVFAGFLAVAGVALLSFGAYKMSVKNPAASPAAGNDPVPPAAGTLSQPSQPSQPSQDSAPAEPVLPSAEDPADKPPESLPEPAPFTMDGLEDEANNTLHDILDDGMTPLEKARAIFDFTHDSIRYTGDSDKSDWEMGAYKGLTERRGDCFTYYAVSRALLTAAGIENLEVQRVGGPTSHFWNLVNCGSGWYHFDATPRSSKLPSFVSFMFTDQQAADYTAKAGRNYFTFDGSLYPERATAPCTDKPAESAGDTEPPSGEEAETRTAQPPSNPESAPKAADSANAGNSLPPEAVSDGGVPAEEPPIMPADTGVSGPEGETVLG